MQELRALPVDGDEWLAYLLHVLENGDHEIHVDPVVGQKARVCIDRMLDFAAKKPMCAHHPIWQKKLTYFPALVRLN
jgi:hypothetical protein